MQKSLVFAAATLLGLCAPALVVAQEHEDSAKHEKSEHEKAIVRTKAIRVRTSVPRWSARPGSAP